MADFQIKETTTPFTVMVFVKRKEGTTFEEFKSYYENHHVPLVVRLLAGQDSFQSYTRHYINHDDSDTFPFGKGESFPFDCCARSEYASKEAYEAFLEEFKKHSKEIGEDEHKYMDQSKMIFLVPGECPSQVVVK